MTRTRQRIMTAIVRLRRVAAEREEGADGLLPAIDLLEEIAASLQRREPPRIVDLAGDSYWECSTD